MKKPNKTIIAKNASPKKVGRLPAKVAIGQLPTGARGLDDILGGGIPEFSFNVIAGSPGGGNHSKDIREYVITDQGVVIIHPRQTDYTGLTTGIRARVGQREEKPPEPKATK